MASSGGMEGGSRLSREMAAWQPRIVSPSELIAGDKTLSDARAQDIVLNSGMAQGAVSIHRDSIVGSQFSLNAKPNAKVLGVDETWAEEAQEVIEARFNLVADSSSNWFDAAGRCTLTGLVRLAVASAVMTGEVLATAEWIRDRRRPFSTAIQMISPFRLSNPNGEMDTDTVKSGVHVGKHGEALGYWIRVKMPGESFLVDDWKWKYVPAAKPWGRKQVIHKFEPLLPSQNRGIGEMVASLKDFKMTKQFSELTLQRAVLQASYAAAIESELPSEAIWAAMGGVTDGAPMVDMLGQYMDGLDSYMKAAQNIRINEQRVPVMFPGTKFHVDPLGHPDSLGTEFEASMLRRIASNLGLSYEQFSRDYTKTNYSSARASMAETWKYMQARKKLVADAFATDAYILWLEEEIALGNIPLPPGYSADDWYDPMFREAFSACTWIGASRGQIDEKKETEAAGMRIANSFSTREEECARLGMDWRQVLRQQAREKKMMEELGLTPPPQPADGSQQSGGDASDDGADQKDKGDANE